MGTHSNKPWQKYRVGKPSTRSNWVEPDCCPLSRVYHVAHAKEAIRILEDGRIRSGLVYDESCLNAKRTCVSWVSPNTWANGSIYGHVQFAFDWKNLVRDKTIYWVEDRQTTKQKIVRLLISDGVFSDQPLAKYDASAGDGPIFHDTKTKQWYHNGAITNEYLILDDLTLADCAAITFCDHHSSLCKKKSGCTEKNQRARDVGAIVLGRLIGTANSKWANKFESDHRRGELDMYVMDALSVLCDQLRDAHQSASDSELPAGIARSLIASMCIAASHGKSQRLKNLAGLFRSPDDVRSAFWTCAEKFFGGLKVRSE